MPDDTPREQQQGPQADWRPIPDPTVLTTEALLRGLQAERDYVDGLAAVIRQRLDGMDRATELLNETVNRVPTALQEAIRHERERSDIRFDAITDQFANRDVAVQAAFAAQKEAAARQDESNQKAIDKAERTTAATIEKNADAAAIRANATDASVADLKERLVGGEARLITIEQRTAGSQAATTEHRASGAYTALIVGLVFSTVIGLAGIILAVAAFIHG